MKRTKRFTIRRIALGLAVAAVLAPAAHAKPTSAESGVEIPYLSHGAGVSHMDFDPASRPSGKRSSEVPYLSHGQVSASRPDFWNYDPKTGEKIADTSPGISADQLAGLYSGSDEAIAPDDLSLSRPSALGSPSGSASGSWEVSTGMVSGFAVALVLLAGASAIAIRHNRKTRLSPA